MSGWFLIALFVTGYIGALLFFWCLCRAAGMDLDD